MIKWFKNKFKKAMMTPQEKYLASSADLADLERRQRELQYNLSNKLGYWI